MMKSVSLFTGVGGFDMGMQRAGIEIVAHAEIDRHASAVLNKHWPQIPNYGDVRHVTKETITEPIDLVCGGFPCQDLSVAGKRAGLAGKRSGMWYEFHRIIAELRPRWVVIENVPGLLSSNKRRDMGIILGALAELRYGYAYRVLDAQYFGVAQRRRRVFIVANLRDWHYPAQVLFEPESCERHTPPSRETGEGVTDYIIKGAAIGRKPEAGPQRGEIRNDGISYTLNTTEVHALARCQTAREGNRQDGESVNLIPYEIHGGSRRKDRPSGGFYIRNEDTTKPFDTGGLNPSCQQGGNLIAFNTRRTEAAPREELSPTLNPRGGGFQGPSIAWHENQGGNITPDPDNIAKALKAGTSHSYQGVGVRRLTPLECERLQGFPDDFTRYGIKDGQEYEQSDTQRYKQLGNAVCVNVVEWIMRRMVAVEGDRLS